MILSAPGMILGLTLASIAFHCVYTSLSSPHFHIDHGYSQI